MAINQLVLTSSCDNSIDLLVESISPVPGKGVLEVGICFKDLVDDDALHRDAQVHETEGLGNEARGHLDHDERHVARRLAAVVHEVHVRPRDVQALL